MEKIKWQTAVVKVPRKMVFTTKKGQLKVAETLTKTNKPSTKNTKPSIVLESGNVNDVVVIKKGVKVQTSDLKGQSQRIKQAKEKIGTIKKTLERAVTLNREQRKSYNQTGRGMRNTRIHEDNTMERLKGLQDDALFALKNIDKDDNEFKTRRGIDYQIKAFERYEKISGFYAYTLHSYEQARITQKEKNELIDPVLSKLKQVKNSNHQRLVNLLLNNDSASLYKKRKPVAATLKQINELLK